MRRLFLFKLWHKLSNKPLSILIQNNHYSFEQIANNEDLFARLLNEEKVRYEYRYYYHNTTIESESIDFKQIDNEIDYSKRIELIGNGSIYFSKERRRIQQEKIKAKSLRLKDLIKKYKLGETNEYKKLGLTPMMNVFVRRGYLDEDY